MEANQYQTVIEALDSLHKRGFTHSFKVENEILHVIETGETFHAKDVTIVEYHRSEGTTDPDDMSVVYALETSNGLRGTIVDAYGPYASESLERFLRLVKLKEGI